MPTSQPLVENSHPWHRGEMYLRAEQRYREETAAAELAAVRTSADALVYQPVPPDGLATDDGIEPVIAPAPAPATAPAPAARAAVVAMTPAAATTPATTPAATRSAVHRSAAGASAPAEAAIPSLIETAHLARATSMHVAQQPVVRPSSRSLNRQRTLIPAAALGVVAIGATLWAVLTVAPGDKPAPVAAATPASTSKPAVAAPASTREPVAATSALSASTSAPAVAAPSSPDLPAHAAPDLAPPPAPARRAVRTPRAIVRAAGTSGSLARARATGRDGQLRVTSTPPGARVTIDGIGWGQTPVTVKNVSLGGRTVRVTHDGYAAHESVVRLDADEPTRTLNVALRRR